MLQKTKPDLLGNFQKWSEMVRERCALYILTWKCASRHNSVHFFDISTSKSAPHVRYFRLFCLQMCFAPLRRAIFFISHLTTWPRSRRFSEVTFRPSGATNQWKNTVNRDFPTFSRACIFFLLSLSPLWSSHFFDSPLWLFPPLLFQLSILSEVSLLNFLRWLVHLWYISIPWSLNAHSGKATVSSSLSSRTSLQTHSTGIHDYYHWPLSATVHFLGSLCILLQVILYPLNLSSDSVEGFHMAFFLIATFRNHKMFSGSNSTLLQNVLDLFIYSHVIQQKATTDSFTALPYKPTHPSKSYFATEL